MNHELIDHKLLKHLIIAGSVRSATAIAEGDTWALVVKIGMEHKTLGVRNTKPRLFRKLETLAKYMIEIGMPHFELEATHFDPSVRSQRRPYISDAMKKAHNAAAYDKWLNAKVQASLDELDAGGETYTSEEIMALTDQDIAEAVSAKKKKKKQATKKSKSA